MATSFGDTASLRAALAVVDDWETEFGTLFSLNPSEKTKQTPRRTLKQPRLKDTTNGATPYTKQQRKDPRKLEILELRAELEELQCALELERAARNVGAAPTPTTNETTDDPSVSAHDRVLEREWENVSARQSHERLASEIENAKLKKLMDSQSKSAQKMAQLTQRLAHLQRSMPAMLQAAAASGVYKGPEVDVDEQRAHLDQLKSHASDVFLAEPFVALQGLQCVRQVHYRDPNPAVEGIQVESEVAWMLPFPVEAVANALWDQARRLAAREKTYDQWNLYEDDKTLVIKFIGHGAVDTSHGQIATLRCQPSTENGSILLVSTVRGCFFVNDECKGFVNGDGWLRVEPVSTSQATPLTRFNWCRRSRVRPPQYETMSTAERSEWIGSVISGPMKTRLENALDWNLQAIENALLTAPPNPTRVAATGS